MDHPGSPGYSSELDDESDRGAHQRVDPLPNGHFASAEDPWEIHFAPGSQAGETEIREVMKVPLGRPGRAALALLGKFPAGEVAANLHRLKQIMETGRVTDTSYAVAGKFAQDTASHTALRPWPASGGKFGRGQKSKNSLLKQILWWLTSMFLPGRCTQQRQSSDGEASAQHLNRREWKQ